MRWIWRALTRRLLLKFTALVCAAALWVYALSATSSVRTITTAISLPVAADAKASVVTPGDVLCPPWCVPVKVTVRGPAKLVRSVEPADLRAGLPPIGASGPGDSKIRLDRADFAAPEGVVVVRVEPEELLLRVSDGRDGGKPAP